MISWKTKLTLLLASTMTIMSGTAIVASLPMIKAHFADVGHIDLLSKLILTAPAIAIAFFAPWTNALAVRFGKKRTLVVALGLFACFGMMGAWMQSIGGILASRLLFGLCVAVIMSISLSLVGDYMEENERIAYLGYQNTFIALGGVLFMAGGGALSEWSWQGAFYIYGTGFLVMAMAMRYIVEVPYKAPEVSRHTPPKLRRHWPIFATALLVMSVFYMVPTQLPYMLVDVHGMSGSAVGMLMATVTFVSAITSLFYAKLRRGWSISHIYGALFLVQGAGFVGLGVADSYAQFSLALTAVGIGVGLVIVNTNSWLLESAQEHERLKATGWLSSSIFLGQFISPLLMQPPVGLVGIAGTFSLVGTMLVAIGFVILVRLVWRVE